MARDPTCFLMDLYNGVSLHDQHEGVIALEFKLVMAGSTEIAKNATSDMT